ncbi:27 kDa hemolymph glycoprotein-like [Uranotaenia lowii]|uniref:27 kDa hemolymph glycoprotein-like n=1 Tax=Uranotaenia lowii TaxID=190385 RepID=UPI00247A94CA|nr:27 kDa hemolymph glycoprotein-like [Uranotaenia lowii]
MSKTSIYLICLLGLVSCKFSSISASSSEPAGSLPGVDLLSELQSKCLNKTGSNETVGMVVGLIDMLPSCMNLQVDLDALRREFFSLTADLAVRKPFFEKYCPQVTSALGCLHPVVHELRKCLDPEETEVINILVNNIPEGIKLVCKNDGEILVAESSIKCEENLMEYVNECFGLTSKITGELIISDYYKKECDDPSATRSCLATKLNECGGSSWMDVIDLFFKPIVKASPCKNIRILKKLI